MEIARSAEVDAAVIAAIRRLGKWSSFRLPDPRRPVQIAFARAVRKSWREQHRG